MPQSGVASESTPPRSRRSWAQYPCIHRVIRFTPASVHQIREAASICCCPFEVMLLSVLVTAMARAHAWDHVPLTLTTAMRDGQEDLQLVAPLSDIRSVDVVVWPRPCTALVDSRASGAVGLATEGGGGVNRAPQNWGRGAVWEKGSIDRTINQLL